jgi:predicted Zn-dependent peptidase
VLQGILADGARSPITEREVELAKNKICSGMILGSERPSNRLFTIGNSWLSRETYEAIRDATEHYKRVTRDELQFAFESLSKRTNVTVSVGSES